VTQYPLFAAPSDLATRDDTIKELRAALVYLLQVSECTCRRGMPSMPCPHERAERLLGKRRRE